MKILVATEKPFAAAAVNGIREIVEGAGHELALLEKYTEKEQLLEAVADADALIVRSDKVTADVVAAALACNQLCVIGGEDKIEEQKDLFMEVKNLF